MEPALRLELQQQRPRRRNRYDIRIASWNDKDRQSVTGWCVYDKESNEMDDHGMIKRIVFRSLILAAVEDECARLNRADL